MWWTIPPSTHAMAGHTLSALLRNVDMLVTACQVAPVLVDNANKVCLKPSQPTGSDAFHTAVVTESNQA